MEVLATVARGARLLVAVYDDLLLWPAAAVTAASAFERQVWCMRETTEELCALLDPMREPRGTVGSQCATEEVPFLLVTRLTSKEGSHGRWIGP